MATMTSLHTPPVVGGDFDMSVPGHETGALRAFRG
jgi:hypothetical protein